jgi:hypothetical protein
MEHYFEIPVKCDDSEQLFRGRLVTFGYDYKFYIIVQGREMIFAKGEKGDFCAIENSQFFDNVVNTNFLGAIITALNNMSVHYQSR